MEEEGKINRNDSRRIKRVKAKVGHEKRKRANVTEWVQQGDRQRGRERDDKKRINEGKAPSEQDSDFR